MKNPVICLFYGKPRKISIAFRAGAGSFLDLYFHGESYIIRFSKYRLWTAAVQSRRPAALRAKLLGKKGRS
ncbi:Major facilitator superfamily (MFS) profile domain-containing protein, partial [Dysosmobacter welbionis]